MKRIAFVLTILAVWQMSCPPVATARGGGRAGGGGGGGARAGGGGGGAARSPSISRPAPAQRPEPSRPSTGQVSRPSAAARPSGGAVARPATPGVGGARPGTGAGLGAAAAAGRPSAKDLGNFLDLPNDVGAAAGDRVAGNRESRQGQIQENRGDRTTNRQDNQASRQQQRTERNDQLHQSAQQRQQTRQEWAGGVRDQWNDRVQNRQDFWNDFKDDFGEPGWRLEYPNIAHGYYHYNHPYAHGWWAAASWAALGTWVGAGWSDSGGAYYDYGSGGNVEYTDDAVTVDGEAAGTPQEYATEAQELAETGAAQLTDPTEKKMDWMPLGVFALSSSKDDAQPKRFLQLAISKEGVINGTLRNDENQKQLPVLGALDRKTQKVAIYAGDKKDVVLETGIFNLTKPETSVLVHFGKDQTQTWMLVRLDPPAEDKAAAAKKTQ